MRLHQFPDQQRFKALSADHNVIPVCVEILADTETPVTLLKKFYRGNGAVFLFESVEGGERWGRYSFLGTSARSDIRVYEDVVEISGNGEIRRIPHQHDPLPVLRSIMSEYDPAEIKEMPRFWGGMVGYVTYEMVSFFEDIPHKLPKNSPLAHFIIADELIIFDNLKNSLLAVAIAFLDENTSPDAAYRNAVQRVDGLLSVMAKPVSFEPEYSGELYRLEPRLDPEVYRQSVSRVKAYIRDGEIIQAVVSQPFTCSSVPDLWMLYRTQRYINPSPYLFFLHLGNTALVGSSPETMVRLENRVATLRPIAGTRPRGANEQEDRHMANELLQDEKEKAEHLMLVDLGRNDLGRVAVTGTVQVTDLMFVERYSHVMHLVSNITCDVESGCDAWDLLRATFPAGTLSGAPKVRAMEIIAEMEETPRGPYGGAVGYVSFSGNMDLAITIRTAVVENGRLTVRAGGGIVADSDPEKERMETVNKSRALEKALLLVQHASVKKEDQP
ncbi:MAG: anthranilate synthase component I family protein [Desulfobacterales bacterium]